MVMGISLRHGIGTGCAARDDLDIGLAGEQGIAFRLEGGIVGIAPARATSGNGMSFGERPL